MYEKKEFKDIETMTKEEAVDEVNAFFKGNTKFIDQAKTLIYSTHGFLKIHQMRLGIDFMDWEKCMFLWIDTKFGNKHLAYDKGRTGSDTHGIDSYEVVIYDRDTMEKEEFHYGRGRESL